MKNTLFEECLANVNPDIRAEVRKNMDAVANCDQSKARRYTEDRILAIPANVNEYGEVFYLDSDLGTAYDGYNGLSGEIERAYYYGYGQALLSDKNPWHKVSEELPKEKHHREITLQGVRDWTESNEVIVIDNHYQKGVDYLKNGEWMKLRHSPKDCDGFLINYLYWMPIPEIKED